jgi:meso-butanediol dehydrogenase / (S,S)-butanediol dehydrogenase / diacetyl reductase
MLLTGKIAVVTGAGRGIGRAIALRFAAEGAAVLVAARTESEVRAVAAKIEKAGGRSAHVTGDVSREADCAHIVSVAENRLGGGVGILVNNAGDYGPVKPIEEISPEEWDRVIAAHLRGAGVILNVSSVSAKSAYPWGAAYAAAKAGMLALTRTTAAESARKGVRANAICPGPVTETKMSQELGIAIGARLGLTPEAELAQFLEGILQGRGLAAAEIAAAAAFLVSDQASAITGQSVNVDGGAVFC